VHPVGSYVRIRQLKPAIIVHHLRYDLFIIFGYIKFGMQIDCKYFYCFILVGSYKMLKRDENLSLSVKDNFQKINIDGKTTSFTKQITMPY